MIEELVQIFFLLPLLAIGLIASYFDFKKGLIPNKILLFGYIGAGLLYSSLLFLNVFYLKSYELHAYIPSAVFNGAVSIFVGFLFWKLGFWSAGDGKLFGLYGLMLPLNFYSESYVEHFPSFAILINLFIPLLLFMGFMAIFHSVKSFKNLSFNFKYFINKKKLIKTIKRALAFFSSFLFAIIIIVFLMDGFNKLKIPTNPFLIFSLLIFIFYLLQSFKKKIKKVVYFKYFVILLFFGRLLLLRDFERSFHYLRTAFVFMLIIGLFQKLIFFHVRKNEVKKVKVKDLKEGALLLKEWRNYFSEKISSLHQIENFDKFERMSAEGLTSDQVKVIKKIFSDNPDYQVEVCRTIPFAPFLFLAVLISVLTSGSLLPLMNDFINFLI